MVVAESPYGVIVWGKATLNLNDRGRSSQSIEQKSEYLLLNSLIWPTRARARERAWFARTSPMYPSPAVLRED